MARQLFLHHYFPALYFAILLFSSFFDMITSALKPKIRLQVAIFLIVVAIWNFSYLSPLVYGNTWTKQSCQNAQWLRTWDFSW
jgi:dolichyl-phosphate-mannose-protein mannosyltransferase